MGFESLEGLLRLREGGGASRGAPPIDPQSLSLDILGSNTNWLPIVPELPWPM